MNISSVILWGFAATIVLTTIMAVSKRLGLSRMDMPFLLGTMFTSNRDKAPLIGLSAHLVIGWVFALIYAAVFKNINQHSWWLGMIIGAVHGSFVLSVGLQVVSTFHPRMAHPYQGPTPTRQLEPPGFFALNYGAGTPLVTIFAHVIYGAILGSLLG